MSLRLAAGPSARGTTWTIGETEGSEPTGAALSSKARGGQTGSARFGFPASSFQYRELIPRLADRYRVIAPDLPGFGFTAVPEQRHYKYTFDALALPGRLDQRVGQGVQEHEGHADPGSLLRGAGPSLLDPLKHGEVEIHYPRQLQLFLP